MEWEEYFLSLAEAVAQKSKDPSRKVGCVITSSDHSVRSTGFNGFPRGIDETDRERWYRPQKYQYVVHAEENAIINAAREGISLYGCTATIQSPPCTKCAKALIQAGIVKIIVPCVHSFKGDERWEEDMHFAQGLLKEAHVEVKWVGYEVSF